MLGLQEKADLLGLPFFVIPLGLELPLFVGQNYDFFPS